MNQNFSEALTSGYERLSAWTELLNRINVFPVADMDTGTNLRISLLPLKYSGASPQETLSRLLTSATGNSGNIAAGFFAGLLPLHADIHKGVGSAQKNAYEAISDPKPGTMLTVFDALVDFFDENRDMGKNGFLAALMDCLKNAVHITAGTLPAMKHAGVVDAGALGMYIFFEGFFRELIKQPCEFQPITEAFKHRLCVVRLSEKIPEDLHCIDTLIQMDQPSQDTVEQLDRHGDNVVVSQDQTRLKIHIHTQQPETLQKKLAGMGEILRWSDDPIQSPVHPDTTNSGIHIMTDGAGSLTREQAQQSGITLLDSYILMGESALPETFVDISDLYMNMSAGKNVTTAQASMFERHQHYESVLDQYEKVLYLCVGSAFTGNFDTVMAWKKAHDPNNRMIVIDSTAASGRLGLMAIAVARYACQEKDTKKVIRFAREMVDRTEEYLFVDKLKFLVKGGRLSRPAGFLGDRLGIKPIISPTREGAIKIGTAKNHEQQLAFAIKNMKEKLKHDNLAMILLEYTNNLDWVGGPVEKEIKNCFPDAEILVQPLSLTSGVHTGPGTWGVAFVKGSES